MQTLFIIAMILAVLSAFTLGFVVGFHSAVIQFESLIDDLDEEDKP